MLNLLEEEYDIVEFKNCYILFKSLLSFADYNDSSKQFDNETKKLIIEYLIRHKYNFEYIDSNSIGCDEYSRDVNDVNIEILYNVKNYTGFLIYKKEN